MSKLLTIALSLILVLLAFTTVSAKQESRNTELPEKDGDYSVADHQNMRVRVFVHGPRPTQVSKPSLVCNPPDPDSTAVVNPTGWHLPLGNWTYTLNPSSVPAVVGSANLATIASTSFNQWSAASGNKITFVKDANNTFATRQALDGKNIIAWGRTSGSALAVTYTWYYTSTHEVAEVDTILNKKFPWSWSGNNGGCANSSSYDVQDILTHEIGHWMGLDDEYASSYSDNTMFGYGSKGEIKKDTLSTGDITGVQAIYP